MAVGTSAAGAATMLAQFGAAIGDDWGGLLQLHTGDPGADGTANVAPTAGRALLALGSPSGGAVSAPLPARVTITGPARVSHASLWDAPVGGTFLSSFPLAEPVDLSAGDEYRIDTYTYAIGPLASASADTTAASATFVTQTATAENPGSPPTGTQPTGPGISRYQDLNHTHGMQNVSNVISFPPGTTYLGPDFMRPDFLDPNTKGPVYADFSSTSAGLIGSGADSTILAVHPDTMSALTASKIPSQSAGGVNPIKTIRLDKGYFQDMTFHWTHQRNVKYGGPMLYQGSNRRMTRVNGRGYHGDNAGPPGETFTLQVWQANGFTFEDCHVSGLGFGSEANTPVSATGFGLDSCTGTMVVRDCSSTDCRYFGMAPYDLGPGTLLFERVDIRRNGYCGLNFERCHDMTIEIVDCDFRDQGPTNQWVMKMGSDKGGSCVINIRDPKWNSTSDGKLHLKCRLASLGGYTNGIQRQNRADVHLFIKGVERPDLIVWHN